MIRSLFYSYKYNLILVTLKIFLFRFFYDFNFLISLNGWIWINILKSFKNWKIFDKYSYIQNILFIQQLNLELKNIKKNNIKQQLPLLHLFTKSRLYSRQHSFRTTFRYGGICLYLLRLLNCFLILLLFEIRHPNENPS